MGRIDIVLKENELALGLAAAGIPLIAVPQAGNGEPLTLPELMSGLLGQENPLFRLSVVPLLLARPQEGEAAFETIRDPLAAHLYTAAVCHQRLWKTRLGLLGRRRELTDRFSTTLGLPDPKIDYGEPCLNEIFDRLRDGRAGTRIRGADRILSKLVHETFELLAREALHAPAR